MYRQNTLQHRTCHRGCEEAYQAEGQVCSLVYLAQNNQISFYQVDSLGKITDCLIHPLEFKVILSLVPHQGTVYFL